MTAKMSRTTRVIPDLYFPDNEQKLQISNTEGKSGQGQDGELGGRNTEELSKKGFIPIYKLTLEDLPQSIRTEENLQYILDFSKRVVKVLNNGVSDQRPDDDQFKKKKNGKCSGSDLRKTKQEGPTGSGCMFLLDSGDVCIITNRHVLFNHEELRRSSFRVQCNLKDANDMKPCRQGDGKLFMAKNSKYDMVRAIYAVKDELKELIKSQCPGCEEIPSQWIPTGSHSMSSTVCLISHPLGGPKHVSFGEVVNFDVHSRTLHHNAPSEGGSSGAPLIVFSNQEISDVHRFLIYHVGRDLETGLKIAHVDYFDSSYLDLDDSIVSVLGKAESAPQLESVLSHEEIVDKAATSLEVMSLAAFAPVFGAFLVQAEKTQVKGHLKPCDVVLQGKSTSPSFLSDQGKELLCKIPKLAAEFVLCPDGKLDLVSLLESRGPCFCQSIVQMMERGVTMEDGTVTECYLSPYTAAAKMSSDSDVTWPWLNRSNTESAIDSAEKNQCLMQKCLKMCERTEGTAIPLILLHMIEKANSWVRHVSFSHCDTSLTSVSLQGEGRSEILKESTSSVSLSANLTEKRPLDAQSLYQPARRKMSKSPKTSSKEALLGLVKGVLVLLGHIFELTLMSSLVRLFTIQREEFSNVGGGREELDDLYSKCLALSEHAVLHERQKHPDTKGSEQEDSSQIRCDCGRPVFSEVATCLDTLLRCVKEIFAINNQDECAQMEPTGCILTDSQLKTEGVFVSYFWLLFHAKQQEVRNKNPYDPGNAALTVLDEFGSFPHGRHSLMLCLASAETLQYNSRLLAKDVQNLLRPLHFAFPVSVYGRPSNWPGNVTPPEVRRTAWRLIQDAIRRAGFRPAVLSALEEDAERREKVIDLYVDMKQLKQEGRIHPFRFRRVIESIRTQCRLRFITQEYPFPDATYWFVWFVGFLICPKSVGF